MDVVSELQLMTSSNITHLKKGKQNLHWCTLGATVSCQLITTCVCANLSNKYSSQYRVLFRVQQHTTNCTGKCIGQISKITLILQVCQSNLLNDTNCVRTLISSVLLCTANDLAFLKKSMTRDLSSQVLSAHNASPNNDATDFVGLRLEQTSRSRLQQRIAFSQSPRSSKVDAIEQQRFESFFGLVFGVCFAESCCTKQDRFETYFRIAVKKWFAVSSWVGTKMLVLGGWVDKWF